MGAFLLSILGSQITPILFSAGAGAAGRRVGASGWALPGAGWGAGSREGPAGLTPPGGVSGRSLKGARSPRPAHSSWSRRELASLSRPAPREVSAVRRAGVGARWGARAFALGKLRPGPRWPGGTQVA